MTEPIVTQTATNSKPPLEIYSRWGLKLTLVRRAAGMHSIPGDERKPAPKFPLVQEEGGRWYFVPTLRFIGGEFGAMLKLVDSLPTVTLSTAQLRKAKEQAS